MALASLLAEKISLAPSGGVASAPLAGSGKDAADGSPFASVLAQDSQTSPLLSVQNLPQASVAKTKTIDLPISPQSIESQKTDLSSLLSQNSSTVASSPMARDPVPALSGQEMAQKPSQIGELIETQLKQSSKQPMAASGIETTTLSSSPSALLQTLPSPSSKEAVQEIPKPLEKASAPASQSPSGSRAAVETQTDSVPTLSTQDIVQSIAQSAILIQSTLKQSPQQPLPLRGTGTTSVSSSLQVISQKLTQILSGHAAQQTAQETAKNSEESSASAQSPEDKGSHPPSADPIPPTAQGIGETLAQILALIDTTLKQLSPQPTPSVSVSNATGQSTGNQKAGAVSSSLQALSQTLAPAPSDRSQSPNKETSGFQNLLEKNAPISDATPQEQGAGTSDVPLSTQEALKGLEEKLKNLLASLPAPSKETTALAISDTPKPVETPKPVLTANESASILPTTLPSTKETVSQPVSEKTKTAESPHPIQTTNEAQEATSRNAAAPSTSPTLASPSRTERGVAPVLSSDTDRNKAEISDSKSPATAGPLPSSIPDPSQAVMATSQGNYRFANALSGLRGGTHTPPPVLDQVIMRISQGAQNGENNIALQLNPTDLGRISIQLNVGTDGQVHGRVTADNPQTLALLQQDQRSLERTLQEAGLQASPGSLQFSLGGQNQGGSAGQMGGGASQNFQDSSRNGMAFAQSSLPESASLEGDQTNGTTYILSPGGVNIHV